MPHPAKIHRQFLGHTGISGPRTNQDGSHVRLRYRYEEADGITHIDGRSGTVRLLVSRDSVDKHGLREEDKGNQESVLSVLGTFSHLPILFFRQASDAFTGRHPRAHRSQDHAYSSGSPLCQGILMTLF